MKNYSYKKTTSINKKMSGIYDADYGVISSDDGDFNILDELKDFEGAEISVSIAVKKEEDLVE